MNTSSPEVEQFFQAKKLDGQFRPVKWLKIIHHLSKLDQQRDEKEQGYRKLQWVAGILAGVGLFSLIVTAEVGYWPASLGVLVLGVLGLIVLWRMKANVRTDDLFNNLRLTARPILTLMQEDFLPGQKLSLEMDCQGPMQPALITETIPKPKRGGLPLIGTTIYTYPWMSGAAVLKDQTQLKWEMVSVLRHRNITKRGSSGKTKIKEKFKVKHRASIRMSFSKSLYQYKSPGKLPPHIKVEPQADRWIVWVKKQEIQQHAGNKMTLRHAFEKQWMQPDTFLKGVSDAYRLFQPLS